ncbi:phosphomannomutase/phosphoglucomutase [Actinorhabdospora filicis]|uniref:Phosphomannomutase/phosphoglucomutase n=1 Tax=Actinorhabdospora filicis TaxID=1785913 RepID=A0A9W6SFQ6_9ACTN|nr:phosphomannomutase/phosphoglucomutase [Actinorhabdospora filicis]GLZ76319.1 phosphomannomutase/phosphoglucomutase [Actinorhabdospora filicis]
MPDLASIVKAYDIRGTVPDQFDAAAAAALGTGFADLVRAEGATKIAVAHDMRDTGPELARAFAEAATRAGLDVVLAGLCSTDELYYVSGILDIPGAMFTASHNPARYNGIKTCLAGARPISLDTGLAAMRDRAQAILDQREEPTTADVPGTITERDFLTDYAAHLRTLVDLSGIRPLTVAVDAGNGMGGHTVPTVFEGLPVTVVPMYFELDGTFPNHEANPLEPANLVDLQKKVVEAGADIGLAFDGDADRCFVIDENGDPVSPSAITALVATRELARDPGATIIYNLITSRAVPEIVAENGGTAVRSRVGHSFIKAEMARTNAIFGGEHSAHYYFRDFWFADTGMLAAMHTLAALGQSDRPLSELARAYERYVASGEINSTVTDAAAKQDQVAAHFATEELDRLDGLTVTFADGAWLNLRASNTEPLLRLNVEAPTPERMEGLRDEVLAIVRG